MTKVRLTLVSASGVEKKETMKALAALYQKPEEHFEPHCEHLFDLKQPFTLLQQVDEAVAEQHREKLVEIGIQCEIQKLGNSSKCHSQSYLIKLTVFSCAKTHSL